ncbi:MAG: hypothetical protein IJB47_05280 [Oscillospiraceae bacterium]|nr:hypothetical protein [Oscillospiraceae bacterium]
MDIRKYSKKTWIAVLVLALASVIYDALTLAGVVGSELSRNTAAVTLVVGLLGVYYSVRGILYHVKKEKEEQE